MLDMWERCDHHVDVLGLCFPAITTLKTFSSLPSFEATNKQETTRSSVYFIVKTSRKNHLKDVPFNKKAMIHDIPEKKNMIYGYIWGFPEMGVPPNHLF